MDILLNIFWSIWEVKYIIFWLYLWQLKEYHVGRFVDHFRTYHGKQLLFNAHQIVKLVLLAGVLFLPPFSLLGLIILALYATEGFLVFRSTIRRSLKKPVFTPKMALLTMIVFSVLIAFTSLIVPFDSEEQIKAILIFDLLTPFLVSLVVLAVQPVFVFFRNITILKAKEKIERIKKKSGLKVIVITGSYGKTSTKEFLHTILKSKYTVLKTAKHQNSEIGIANEILHNLTTDHNYFIVEVGAYNKGKVKEVCSFLKPHVGIVTGVNSQHLSLFGSMKNLLSAEGGLELEEALPTNGLLIVNGDNVHCRNLYKQTEKNKRLYAQSNKVVDADIFAEDIVVRKDSLSFIVLNKHRQMHHFHANVLGKHNVNNLLASIITANSLGMTLEDIAQASRAIHHDQAGMVLEDGKHGLSIIDSSYSANPDGVFADLDYLSVFPQKKVIIMPSLIELGNKSADVHYQIGKKIASICDLAIITSKDQFKNVRSGCLDAGMDAKNIIFCEKPGDIFTMVTLFCKAGDAVLLEGRVPTSLKRLLAL